MFVASLEGVSELFIAGVEVEDSPPQLTKEKELGATVNRKASNGILRKPVPNGNST
jgi:phosphatidylinositol glycan class N